MIPTEVVQKYKNNSLIVQVQKTPKERSKAYNDQDIKIGNVKEIFGPKNSPYILINIDKGINNIEKLIQENNIYLEG